MITHKLSIFNDGYMMYTGKHKSTLQGFSETANCFHWLLLDADMVLLHVLPVFEFCEVKTPRCTWKDFCTAPNLAYFNFALFAIGSYAPSERFQLPALYLVYPSPLKAILSGSSPSA